MSKRTVGPRTAGPGIWRRTVIRTVLVLAVLALVAWYGRGKPVGKDGPAQPPGRPADQGAVEAEVSEPAVPAAIDSSSSDGNPDITHQIPGMVIRDQSGDVAFRGTVDLSDSIERIQSGKKLRFPNDGSVFQNREKRLPAQPAGYYREWVHPTPDLDGPGPQRIVTGQEGEIYYTPDHYRTFRRLDGASERTGDSGK